MVRSTLTLLALFNVAILFPGKAMSQNSEGREFNGKYQKEYLDKIAFPIGGIGAGMFCLEGTGAISHVSLRHHPDVMNEPYTFAAIYVKGVENGAKVLEGQVPTWKLFGPAQSGLGRGDKTYGLPRFEEAVFQTRFPFATIEETRICLWWQRLRVGVLLFRRMRTIPAYRLEYWNISLQTLPIRLSKPCFLIIPKISLMVRVLSEE